MRFGLICHEVTPADTRNLSFFQPLQKLLRNLTGLAVIPNMEIYMKWTDHLCVGGCFLFIFFFESGSKGGGGLADKNPEYE